MDAHWPSIARDSKYLRPCSRGVLSSLVLNRCYKIFIRSVAHIACYAVSIVGTFTGGKATGASN